MVSSVAAIPITRNARGDFDWTEVVNNPANDERRSESMNPRVGRLHRSR